MSPIHQKQAALRGKQAPVKKVVWEVANVGADCSM